MTLFGGNALYKAGTQARFTGAMISSPLAAALARRNIHYGWIVVGVTFLTMLVTAGAMGAPGVLIVPLEREFGWDNAQIRRRWRCASCCSDCSARLPPLS